MSTAAEAPVKKKRGRKKKIFTLTSTTNPSAGKIKLVLSTAELSDLSVGKPVLWQHKEGKIEYKDQATVFSIDAEVGRVFIKLKHPGTRAIYAHVWPRELILLVSRKFVLDDKELRRDRSKDKVQTTPPEPGINLHKSVMSPSPSHRMAIQFC